MDDQRLMCHRTGWPHSVGSSRGVGLGRVREADPGTVSPRRKGYSLVDDAGFDPVHIDGLERATMLDRQGAASGRALQHSGAKRTDESRDSLLD